MEGIKKQRSISKIFAMYIVSFCIVSILLALANLIIFQIGLNSGIILPANYYEQKIEKHREELEKAEEVKEIVPKECKYAVYDIQGNVLEKNVSEEKALDMWDIIKSDRTSKGKYFYKVIKRDNGICIVEYRISASFASSVLQKYIPNVELLLNIFILGLFIIEIMVFSRFFKRRISKEMQILKDTTENIQMENLDFKVKYSNILEINEVISALDKMKSELNESLNKQWKMEDTRKEQMAALAHDIKTPLTIIKGNSELLSESDLNGDQAEFNNYILNEVKNMEDYIKSLIEIMKSEKESVIEKKKINIESFLQDILKQGILMSKSKNIKFESEVKNIPEFITVDESAIKRVISNIISNAVEYCRENSEILFYVDSDEKTLEFIIEDSGKGFTQEELQLATEQFFQGDKSRNSKNHYGMGLYIARKLIEKHNGSILLENSKKLGGAKVKIKIPL